MNQNKKPLVIYHHPCSDGFAAALAAWRSMGDRAEYCGREHNMPFDTLPSVEGREVYILDFSFTTEQMSQILNSAKKVVWLDHHKTAFEDWCGHGYLTEFRQRYTHSDGDEAANCYIDLDNNKSGAMLAWEYFHGHAPTPKMVRLIDDNDRWQFKLPETKAFIFFLGTVEKRFEEWNDIVERTEQAHYFDEYMTTGRILEQSFNKQLSEILCKTKRVITITDCHKGWAGLASNIDSMFASDAGNTLAQESGTFGMTWNQLKDGSVRCSLRSNGSYDVSRIAKRMGGGGHCNAAAFSTTMRTLQSWLN